LRRKHPRKRHLTAEEIRQTAEWIATEPTVPSWEAVREYVLRSHNVDRTIEALRKNPRLQCARRLPRRTSPRPRRSPIRPKDLQAKVTRLELRVAELEDQNQALFERNLRLINALRARNIPEEKFDRPIPIAHRQASEPPNGRLRG
jgi:hypothetical protein